MEKKIPLSYFAYSVTSSTVIATTKNGAGSPLFSTPLPLAEIVIDFEHGHFILEGDWHFMMAANRHVEQSWFGFHRERVKIEVSIYPSMIPDLSDEKNDGLAFALDGTLKDGEGTGDCFGLLVLENAERQVGCLSSEWNITFYLYDALNDDCEIRMKLPVHAASPQEQLS